MHREATRCCHSHGCHSRLIPSLMLQLCNEPTNHDLGSIQESVQFRNQYRSSEPWRSSRITRPHSTVANPADPIPPSSSLTRPALAEADPAGPNLPADFSTVRETSARSSGPSAPACFCKQTWLASMVQKLVLPSFPSLQKWSSLARRAKPSCFWPAL